MFPLATDNKKATPRRAASLRYTGKKKKQQPNIILGLSYFIGEENEALRNEGDLIVEV